MQVTQINSSGIEVANMEGTLLASASRTISVFSATQTNYNAKGLILFLDVTAVSGTGGLNVKFVGIDPVTGKNFVINVDGTVITTTGMNGYVLYPGANATTGATSNVKQFWASALPRKWTAYVFNSDGTPYTYSLGYSLIL